MGIVPKKKLDPFQFVKAAAVKRLRLKQSIIKGRMAQAELAGRPTQVNLIKRKSESLNKLIDRINEERWRYRATKLSRGGNSSLEGHVEASSRNDAANAIQAKHGHKISIHHIVPHGQDPDRDRSDPSKDDEYKRARAKSRRERVANFAKWKQQRDGRWWHPDHGYAKSKKKSSSAPEPGKARWAPRVRESLDETKAELHGRYEKLAKTSARLAKTDPRHKKFADLYARLAKRAKRREVNEVFGRKPPKPGTAPMAKRAERVYWYEKGEAQDKVRLGRALRRYRNGDVLVKAREGDKRIAKYGTHGKTANQTLKALAHSRGIKFRGWEHRELDENRRWPNAYLVKSANASHKHMWRTKHKLLDALRLRRARMDVLMKDVSLSRAEREARIKRINAQIKNLRKRDRERSDVWLRQVSRIKA